MVILAIDYGDSRTGIALCDKFEMMAVPLTVIAQKDQKALIVEIAALAKDKKAEMLLVGLPKNMDGSLGFRAKASMDFAKRLERAVELPVEFWDERLSTVSAHTLLNQTDTRGAKRKKVIDAVAATMILQDFLDYRKNKA